MFAKYCNLYKTMVIPEKSLKDKRLKRKAISTCNISKIEKEIFLLARCDNICYNNAHGVLIPYNQISPDEVYRKSRELLPKE